MEIGDDSTITVRYQALADVTVRYVDELGNEINDLMPEGTAFLLSGDRGDKVQVQTPDMADYVYESMSISTEAGKVESRFPGCGSQGSNPGLENASTVTVVYHAKASVNVRYVDELGTPIDDLMPEGSATIIAGTLRGEALYHGFRSGTWPSYDFEQMSHYHSRGPAWSPASWMQISSDLKLNKEYASTVTLVYHAKASFKVEYVDDLGQNINDVIAAALAVGNPFEYTGHRRGMRSRSPPPSWRTTSSIPRRSSPETL